MSNAAPSFSFRAVGHQVVANAIDAVCSSILEKLTKEHETVPQKLLYLLVGEVVSDVTPRLTGEKESEVFLLQSTFLKLRHVISSLIWERLSEEALGILADGRAHSDTYVWPLESDMKHQALIEYAEVEEAAAEVAKIAVMEVIQPILAEQLHKD